MSKYVSKFDVCGETILIKDELANDHINKWVKPENVVIVGKDGQFTSINDAVRYLVGKHPELAEHDSNYASCAILIQPNVYYESLDLGKISGLIFYGLGDVRIHSNQPYPVGCINGYGKNWFFNLYLQCSGENAYAMHYEGGGVELESNATKTYFENCTFVSSKNSAVGIGSANKNTNLEFNNCQFAGAGWGSVYMHNSSYDGSVDNKISFRNCRGDVVRIEDAARTHANRSSILGVEFENNQFTVMSFYGGTQGNLANSTVGTIHLQSENIVMLPTCHGNLGKGFNISDRYKQVEIFATKGDKGNWSDSFYSAVVEDADKYNWSLYSVVLNNGVDVTHSCSVIGYNNCLRISDPTSQGVGGVTSITAIGIPK